MRYALVSRTEGSGLRDRAVQEELWATLAATMAAPQWADDERTQDDVMLGLRRLREGVLASGLADEFACTVYEASLRAAYRCRRWDDVLRCEGTLVDLLLLPEKCGVRKSDVWALKIVRLAVSVQETNDGATRSDMAMCLYKTPLDVRHSATFRHAQVLATTLSSAGATALLVAHAHDNLLEPFLPRLRSLALSQLRRSYRRLPIDTFRRFLALPAAADIAPYLVPLKPEPGVQDPTIFFYPPR